MADSSSTESSFRLPAPSFGAATKKSIDSFTKLRNPHFSTPSGMLLPREKQPPPMYGPRGATVPPWLVRKGHHQHQYGSSKGEGNYQQPRFRGPPRGHFNSGFDKDVIPELLEVNWNLWCEGCDVNCRTEAELERHKKEHQACQVEGCKYVGHPRVMKRHWRLAHDEQKLQEKAQMETKQTPEDIEKWRQERRMRYPSKANVLRRMQEQEERFKRGERIEEDKTRFPNKKQWEPSKDKGRSFNTTRRSRQRVRKAEQAPEAAEKESDSDEDVQSKIRFKGTSELKDYKEKQKNSLSLLCAYGSDSEESSEQESGDESVEVDKETESPVQELETSISTETVASTNSYLSEGEIPDSESDQEEVVAVEEIQHQEQNTTPATEDPTAKVDQTNTETDATKTKKRNRTHKRRNDVSQDGAPTQSTSSKNPRLDKPILNYAKLRHARQNTLLEKLLEPEIRHERNVLLQCVRFVVQNSFFGIGQPKESASHQLEETQD
ncbi:AAEL000699-PA [Aedes aegypti]|uniref:AAEL000699-PA n=1 Tax=Aedes aegypti TaxID=7159 RepID=Q17NH8_AEDAE|nr:AAEL000699-PA [Aedes aegypti]